MGAKIMKSLHNAIMNLPCDVLRAESAGGYTQLAYKLGHRDARHAAAELANEADRCIEELEADLKTTRTTIRVMDQGKALRDARIDDFENALKLLINALPISRDWLDPDIERFAKALLKERL